MQHFLEYEHVHPPRDGRSHAKDDDGKGFFADGLTVQRDGSLGKSPAQYAAEARAAQEAASPQGQSTVRGRAELTAKTEAETMRGDSHSDTATLQRIFVTDATEINWQKTLNERRRIREFLRNRRAVVR